MIFNFDLIFYRILEQIVIVEFYIFTQNFILSRFTMFTNLYRYIKIEQKMFVIKHPLKKSIEYFLKSVPSIA